MTPLPTVTNLLGELAQVAELWSPRVVATLNGQYVKVARLRGEFVWHKHDAEDELFLVVAGRLTIRFRDGEVELAPGEFVIVPKGVEHLPVAAEEAHIVLVEPKTTLNTGDVVSERTVAVLDRI